MQVIRRIAKHYPDAKIDRLTTLDPHPTSLKDKSLWSISTNPTFDYQITLPNNVLTAENYFRRSSTLRDWYEPASGNYSGVPVIGASVNEQKEEKFFKNGCTVLAHTNVPSWYFGTINPQDPLILYRQCNEKHQPPTEWYPQGKTKVGYNAILSQAQGVAPSALDAGKSPLETIFNGDFEYSSYGWQEAHTKVIHQYATLEATQFVKHHPLFFPAVFKTLQCDVKTIQAVELTIRFFDVQNVVIQTVTKKIASSKTGFQTIDVPIPNNLLGKVGTFSIQNSGKTVLLDKFRLNE
jgi:hypothetical protein